MFRRFTSSNVCLHTLFIVVLIVSVGDCDEVSVSEFWIIFPNSVRNVRFGIGGGVCDACAGLDVDAEIGVARVVAVAAAAAVAVFDGIDISLSSPQSDCLCNNDD